MGQQKGRSRKTSKIVRMPATKFAHLRKRIEKRALRQPSKAKPRMKIP